MSYVVHQIGQGAIGEGSEQNNSCLGRDSVLRGAPDRPGCYRRAV